MLGWRGVLDGVVQTDGARFFPSEPLCNGHGFRVRIKVGDSPSDSLDNSTIVSNFLTFTTVGAPLGGKLAGHSGRGLPAPVSPMTGLFTIEPADWRLLISADKGGMCNGRPCAL